MARFDLTGEQRDAVYAAGNVLVRAGAGSGKTEVLAQRFVALLAGDIAGREPLAPERIAAITFTEKATADMRRRIAEVLDDRIARESEVERRAALIRARRTLGLARISTIHAFCARMLREYPIEAGVDPGFEVLDEYQSMTFLEGQCRDSIADAVRRQKPGAIRLVGARGLYGFTHQMGAIEVVLKLSAKPRVLADRTTGFAHPPRRRRLSCAHSAPRFPGFARNSWSWSRNCSRHAALAARRRKTSTLCAGNGHASARDRKVQR